jgi:hypothetical protein
MRIHHSYFSEVIRAQDHKQQTGKQDIAARIFTALAMRDFDRQLYASFGANAYLL